MDIKISGPEDLIPKYAQEGDAGCDLRSAEDIILRAGDYKLVKTGVSIALPSNVVALVHPRSGLALHHGITVLNAPGTIDSGYRGEIGVLLHNVSDIAFQVFRGDRIAQMVFQTFESVVFKLVSELDSTVRNKSGFGSTGKK